MTDQSSILSGATAPLGTPETVTADPQVTPEVVTQPANPFQEQLSAIKNGEGLQKYASVQDALTGTAHAQEYIRTLKGENEDLEDRIYGYKLELEKRQSVSDAMSQMASTTTPQVTPGDGVGREDVYSMMKDYESIKAQESNRKSVIETLVQHCNGDEKKATEMVNRKLEDMNMSHAQIQQLASTSPKAVYELLGVGPHGLSSRYSSMSGTINTDAIETHKSTEVRQPKRLPIGADTSELVSEWKAAKAEVNLKLGI